MMTIKKNIFCMLFFLMGALLPQYSFAGSTSHNSGNQSHANINALYETILKKGGKQFGHSLIETYKIFKDILSFDDLMPHFQRLADLSDSDWQKITSTFEKLAEEQRQQWIGAFLFSKKNSQEAIDLLPKFLRERAAVERLEKKKKEAVDGMRQEYESIMDSSMTNDILFTGLGVLRGTVDQYEKIDVSKSMVGLNKDQNVDGPLNSGLLFAVKDGTTYASLWKEAWYAFRNAPRLLDYLTSTRRLTPSDEEIKEAQEEYFMTQLGPHIIEQVSKDLAQNGMNIAQMIAEYEKPQKRDTPVHMVKFNESADRLVQKLFPFLPEAVLPMAQTLTREFLFSILPSFARMICTEQWEMQIARKKSGKDESVSWNEACESFKNKMQSGNGFKLLMENDQNRFVCYHFIHSICWSVIAPSLGSIASHLYDVSPYLPLLVTSKSYKAWTDIISHLCFAESQMLGISKALIPGLGPMDQINATGRSANERYWSMYKTNGEDRYAKSLDEYLQVKIPETVTRMALGGGLHAGFHRYRNGIVDTVESIGSAIAKGTKMVLPQAISSRLIRGVSFTKQVGEQLALMFVPLYAATQRMSKMGGQVGFVSALESFSDPRKVNQHLDAKISQTIAKDVFYTVYNNFFKNGAASAKTASWQKILGQATVWFLYNAGTKNNKSQGGKQGLRALFG